MRYYPVFLDLQNRPCLVVGGGAVGLRKVKTLLECGAVVTVVSPQADGQLLALSRKGSLSLRQRPYRTGDLKGMFLVIGATNSKKLNLRINREAQEAGLLCNIADLPEACHFILPSIVKRGDLTIAISTAGKSPAFAKKLRQDLEKKFGPEIEVFLDLMGAIRTKLLEQHEPEAHKPIFERLVAGELLSLVGKNKKKEIDGLLSDILGEGFEFEALIKRGSEGNLNKP